MPERTRRDKKEVSRGLDGRRVRGRRTVVGEEGDLNIRKQGSERTAVSRAIRAESKGDDATHGRQGSRLLAAVLAAGRGEDATELADERTAGPEAAGGVEEGADLGRGAAVAGREADWW
jgi:hypothetical protein